MSLSLTNATSTYAMSSLQSIFPVAEQNQCGLPINGSGVRPFDPIDRLYESPNESLQFGEKSVGYVVGERILAPMIDKATFLTKSIFSLVGDGCGYLGNTLSKAYHFQIFPSAEAIPLVCDPRYETLETCRSKAEKNRDAEPKPRNPIGSGPIISGIEEKHKEILKNNERVDKEYFEPGRALFERAKELGGDPDKLEEMKGWLDLALESFRHAYRAAENGGEPRGVKEKIAIEIRRVESERSALGNAKEEL